MGLSSSISPDRDIEAVSETASLLSISEFQLFKTAYCAWYGRNAGDTRMEPFFADFMFRDIVPHWVRHFVRRLRDADEPDDSVIPPACTLPRRKIDPKARRRGWFLLAGFAVFILLFCLMLVYWIPPA